MEKTTIATPTAVRKLTIPIPLSFWAEPLWPVPVVSAPADSVLEAARASEDAILADDERAAEAEVAKELATDESELVTDAEAPVAVIDMVGFRDLELS